MTASTTFRTVSRRNIRSAFTLIELLLVMMIIAILAAIVVPKFTDRTKQAQITRAKADISLLKQQIQAFEIDNGALPTQEQGLASLQTNPGNLPNWKPYVETVPLDPWGTAYIYRNPGTNGHDFDLTSAGPDKQEGTSDDIDLSKTTTP